MENYHIPVMAGEALDLLDIRPDGTYADLTFGGGGHSRLILSRLGSGGRLFGFDQDAEAAANAPQDDRFTFVRSNFRFMRSQLRALGVECLDGVLADLGVSSHHFDTSRRGFSFRFDSPLDMRMNENSSLNAFKVVNEYPAEQLTEILGSWGEIATPYKAANCIIRARENGGIHTTFQLAEAVAPCTPKKDAGSFMAKLFQALRIEVNGEMAALEMALEQSLKILKPGGRLVVISYHSLEDRIVKNFLKTGNVGGKTEKDFYGNISSPFRLVTKKALTPSPVEVASNPRSRSAKMRAAQKI